MLYQPTQDNIGFVRKLRRTLNGMGRKHACCVCGKTFFRFSNYRGGWKAFSVYLHNVQWTGSDFEPFLVPVLPQPRPRASTSFCSLKHWASGTS